MQRIALKTHNAAKLLIAIVLLTTALPIWAVPSVFASTIMPNRYDQVADSAVSAVTTHLIGFTYTDMTTSIGSIGFEFCANDPIPETVCTAPAGFDITAAFLDNQTGEAGFSIHANTTANNLILTRAATIPTTGDSSYELVNVVNPSTLGTYYIRIETFSSSDGTGSAVQAGGVALSTVTPFTVSTEVPPYLKFCAAIVIGSYDCSTATTFSINFGEFSTAETRTASSEMVAATNAGSGYSISMSGTTLTSGNNVIPALISLSASSPGTGQFGVNLRANTNPSGGANTVGPGTATASPDYNVPNRFKFQQGESVAGVSGSNDDRKFTVSYIANVANNQAQGVYATTISFICLANF